MLSWGQRDKEGQRTLKYRRATDVTVSVTTQLRLLYLSFVDITGFCNTPIPF